MRRELAIRIRQIIEQSVVNLPDEDALDAPLLFPHFDPNGKSYITGERFFYPENGKLYKVLLDHTSQSDWLPTTAVSLYVEVAPPDTIPDWVQPTGAHDAYQKGDKVRFNSKVWESLVDANVWQPEEGSLWTEIN